MSGNVHNNDGFNRTGIKLILLSVCSWAIFSFTCMNAYSVWVPAVADKIGMDFADLNMWNTYGGLIAAVATFAASHVVRKFGSRKTLFVSLGICGLNFLFIPKCPAAFACFGVALNAVLQVFYGNMSTTVLMKNWYPRKNAVVMGWVTAGTAIGGFIMLPIFNSAIQSKGLDTAMAIFGILFIVIAVLDLILVRDTPEMCGFDPDGMPMSAEEQKIHLGTKKEKNPWTLKKIFTNKRMVAMSVGWGLELMCITGTLSCAILIMISKGIEQKQAVTIASIGAVLAIVGSVVSGIVADKIGTKKASMLFIGVQLVFTFLMVIAGVGQTVIVIIGYALVVFMSGSPSNLSATSVLKLTGARFFTVAWGTIFMVINLFRAAASSVISFSLKTSGGYNLALWIFVGCLVASIVLIHYAGEEYQNPGIEEDDEVYAEDAN